MHKNRKKVIFLQINVQNAFFCAARDFIAQAQACSFRNSVVSVLLQTFWTYNVKLCDTALEQLVVLGILLYIS